MRNSLYYITIVKCKLIGVNNITIKEVIKDSDMIEKLEERINEFIAESHATGFERSYQCAGVDQEIIMEESEYKKLELAGIQDIKFDIEVYERWHFEALVRLKQPKWFEEEEKVRSKTTEIDKLIAMLVKGK